MSGESAAPSATASSCATERGKSVWRHAPATLKPNSSTMLTKNASARISMNGLRVMGLSAIALITARLTVTASSRLLGTRRPRSHWPEAGVDAAGVAEVTARRVAHDPGRSRSAPGGLGRSAEIWVPAAADASGADPRADAVAGRAIRLAGIEAGADES